MKKVSALLIVYAIIVIASCIYWVRFALSKSSLTTGSNAGGISLAADPDNMKQQEAKIATDKATELTGGFTDDVKSDGQAMRHREVK